jgi:hemin uptake protein HemP
VAAIPALPASPPSQQVLESSELLRGARLVEIRHNGEIYRLQATRLGKLILTK